MAFPNEPCGTQYNLNACVQSLPEICSLIIIIINTLHTTPEMLGSLSKATTMFHILELNIGCPLFGEACLV